MAASVVKPGCNPIYCLIWLDGAGSCDANKKKMHATGRDIHDDNNGIGRYPRREPRRQLG
jgi:hypothetical protein